MHTGIRILTYQIAGEYYFDVEVIYTSFSVGLEKNHNNYFLSNILLHNFCLLEL